MGSDPPVCSSPLDRRRRARRRGRIRLAVVIAVLIAALGGAAVLVHRAGNARASADQPSPAPTKQSRRVAPGGPGGWVKDPQPVPILVYHHVQPKLGGSPLMYVSPNQFAAQLAWLEDNGYEAVTLDEAYDAWRGLGTLPVRPVVISFDDGYPDQYEHAAPLLARHGWPGVLNLVVERGTALRHEQVADLVAAGWELDSHTIDHELLTRLGKERLRVQVRSSRIMLQRFGEPVRFFCYVGGVYDKRVVAAVKRAGYKGATTTKYGAATPRDIWEMPRIAVYWGESLGTFGERLGDAVAAAKE